jgi:phosphohistidine phosphatase
MHLFLMRHGPYLAKDRDPEEGLSPQGEELIQRVAHELKDLGVAPELVLTSPKKRARQTALITAQVLGYPENNIRETSLLKAMTPPEETLKHLTGLKDRSILSVGHLPNLRLAASLLLCGNQELDISFEAGSVCSLDINQTRQGPATLRWLLKP